MAHVARATDTAFSANHHALVSCGAKNNFSSRNIAEEDAVLSALWSRVPGLVRLPATGCLHMCLAVGSQPIQDHHV